MKSVSAVTVSSVETVTNGGLVSLLVVLEVTIIISLFVDCEALELEFTKSKNYNLAFFCHLLASSTISGAYHKHPILTFSILFGVFRLFVVNWCPIGYPC